MCRKNYFPSSHCHFFSIQENARADLSATYDVAASPFRKNPHIAALSDLDRTTFSERSIDDAIYERSQGTLSPTSPAHLLGRLIVFIWVTVRTI